MSAMTSILDPTYKRDMLCLYHKSLVHQIRHLHPASNHVTPENEKCRYRMAD